MVFYLEFKDTNIGIIDPLCIGSFSFLFGIFHVYAGAKVLLKDFARKHNNDIKTGMDVDIHFVEQDVPRTDPGYVVHMSVLSFKKVPGPSTTNYIDLTLVSKSYFFNSVKTLAYSGTISQIAERVYQENFAEKNCYNSFNSVESSDRSRIRYQLGERSMDFLNRICKYGYKNNKPIFLYSDSKGDLNLSSLSLMEDSTPKNIITPFTFPQDYQRSSASLTTPSLIAMEYYFNGANQDSISEYTSVFSTQMFVSPRDYNSQVSIPDTEQGNAQTERISPAKKEFYGWNLSPEDALGISVRKNFERVSSTYTFDAIFDSFMVKELPLGSVHYVLLPYEPTANSSNGSKVNAGEGKYMVSQVKFVYSDNLLRTQAHFIQVAY